MFLFNLHLIIGIKNPNSFQSKSLILNTYFTYIYVIHTYEYKYNEVDEDL